MMTQLAALKQQCGLVDDYILYEIKSTYTTTQHSPYLSNAVPVRLYASSSPLHKIRQVSACSSFLSNASSKVVLTAVISAITMIYRRERKHCQQRIASYLTSTHKFISNGRSHR